MLNTVRRVKAISEFDRPGHYETTDFLLHFSPALYREDKGTQGRTLGPVTLLVEMLNGAITEEEVWDCLKNRHIEISGA